MPVTVQEDAALQSKFVAKRGIQKQKKKNMIPAIVPGAESVQTGVVHVHVPNEHVCATTTDGTKRAAIKRKIPIFDNIL